MRYFFYLLTISVLVTSLFIVSCDDDDDLTIHDCNVTNPIEELEWLQETIAELEQEQDEYSYIKVAEYKNHTVYFAGSCHPSINFVSYVLDCKAEEIGTTNELYNDLKNIRVLWKPENSICNFSE